MFRKGTRLARISINVIFDWGGLGDQICRIPALRYLLEKWPYVFVHLYVPDYFEELALEFLKSYKNLEIKAFSRTFQFFNKEYLTFNFSCTHHTTMKTHLVDHAFHVLTDTQILGGANELRNYPSLQHLDYDLSYFALPQQYVVLTPCFTAKVREWNSSDFSACVDVLLKNNFTPVFLGREVIPTGTQTHSQIEASTFAPLERGMNLMNKTSLLEAYFILKNASLVMGVDNGLIHLAGCSNVPIIAGYTTVDPVHRLPIRNNIMGSQVTAVTPRINCRFCQTNWHFFKDHDYRECFYKDYACVKEVALLPALKDWMEKNARS